MTEIASRQHPKIKLARSLHQKKARRETGLLLVEGLRHLGELAESDFTVEYVLYAPESLTSEYGSGLIEAFTRRGTEVFTVRPEILESVSSRAGSASALAVARQAILPLDMLDPQRAPRCVALVSPQDPGNIGTILRTMDAVRAGALLLLDGGADPWQPEAVRASMGAIFWHPIVQASFREFAAWAAARQVAVYGTSAHASTDYRQAGAFRQPNVLLLGSEREGLNPEQAAVCTGLLSLPMRGRGTSLNLAVAAGVFLYAMAGEA